MTQMRFLVLATTTVLAMVIPASARADVRRERSERRPYIVELGDPYSIDTETLQHEADYMSELSDYVSTYGYPDYAEVQEIAPDWPWDPYEVRLYYLRRNLETDFGHVIMSAALTDLGVLKFQGDIPSEKRQRIEMALQAHPSPPAATESTAASRPTAPVAGGLSATLVARLEAAAERAAQAAERAEAESDAAARAADRAVRIVDKMEQPRRTHEPRTP